MQPVLDNTAVCSWKALHINCAMITVPVHLLLVTHPYFIVRCSCDVTSCLCWLCALDYADCAAAACRIRVLLLAPAASSLPVSAKQRWACGPFCLPLILPVLLCQSCCLNNGAVFLSANLGTNICLRGKQALPGSAINRIIKQTVMSRIIANYDKICFGICLRGSRVLKSAQEFITAASEQAPE